MGLHKRQVGREITTQERERAVKGGRVQDVWLSKGGSNGKGRVVDFIYFNFLAMQGS